MPTGVYVRKNAVWSRLKAGMAADHVDDFTEWLRERRYTEKTIVEHVRLLACWTNWALSEGYRFATIRSAYAASFALIRNGHRPRFRGDINKDVVEIAKLFISYLEVKGKLACLPAKIERLLIAEFAAWAREQHGLAETNARAPISARSARLSRRSAMTCLLMMRLRFGHICSDARGLCPSGA